MSVETVGSWLNALSPLLTTAGGIIGAAVAGWAQAKYSHKKSGA